MSFDDVDISPTTHEWRAVEAALKEEMTPTGSLRYNLSGFPISMPFLEREWVTRDSRRWRIWSIVPREVLGL